MAIKAPLEPTPFKVLQRYHQALINTFNDGETLVDAVQRRPGIYGPNPIAFLSILARRPSVTIGDLEEALVNDRALVRAGAFRTSLFLIATEDYPLYFRAFNNMLSKAGMDKLRAGGVDDHTLVIYAHRLRESKFPMSKASAELLDIILPVRDKKPPQDIARLIFRKLCDLGVLVRTTSKGWKGNQYNYALVENWLNGMNLTKEQGDQARTEVTRRYLSTYGPARVEDVEWWTGFTPQEVRRSIDNLGREVLQFPVEGLDDKMIGLRETVESIRKWQCEPGRVQFLPLWDAYLLGWADRTRVVSPKLAPWVYDAAGNTASTIVEDGRVIGLWQFRDGDSITLEFHVFEPYANRLNAIRLAADDYASSLARVAGSSDIRVIERALPVALADRPPASFMWPLGKEPVFQQSGYPSIVNPMDRRGTNKLRASYLDDAGLSGSAD
jgi:hypothetical protein